MDEEWCARSSAGGTQLSQGALGMDCCAQGSAGPCGFAVLLMAASLRL